MLCKVVVIVIFFWGRPTGALNNEISDCNPKILEEIQSYKGVVNRILETATKGRFRGKAFNELTQFVDKFGPRVSGSDNLERAIDYMLALLKKNGLENVKGEEVLVPHWLRGAESAVMLEPHLAHIPVLGLGASISTPIEGVTGEVLVVASFDELANRSVEAKGRIIVFNNEYVSYGVSVAYRSRGGAEAEKYGGLAALVRSVTPFSLGTLHTGAQGASHIPVASITVENARMLHRLQNENNKIIINLKMNSTKFPDKISRNTVGEVVGTDLPKHVVLVSGHIDSWDVGVGAMDDGGGAFISWEALALIKSLGLRPRRTLRVVLWTAEEPGLVGAFAYNRTHAEELKNFTFVMESDEGTFTPRGLEYQAGPQGTCILQEILKLMAPINATQGEYGDNPGSDITVFTESGIPGASLLNDNQRYFWYHHSEADSMDVLNTADLDKCTALFAAVAYILADLSVEFPREPPRV